MLKTRELNVPRKTHSDFCPTMLGTASCLIAASADMARDEVVIAHLGLLSGTIAEFGDAYVAEAAAYFAQINPKLLAW